MRLRRCVINLVLCISEIKCLCQGSCGIWFYTSFLSIISSSKVLSIWFVATETPLEYNSRITCNSVRIGETSVTTSHIPISSASIIVVHDRFRKLLHMTELFTGFRGSINCWKETARPFLCSWTVHIIESAVVIINVRISSSTIDFVHHVSELPIEIRVRGFRVRNREWALCCVVFCTAEHIYSIFNFILVRQLIN